jgi:hypothetical protein
MSLMNLCDDKEYIYEKAFRESASGSITIDLVNGCVVGSCDKDIIKYAKRYKEGLKKHLAKERSSPLKTFVIRVSGGEVMAYAIDNRNKDYQIQVM